MTSIEKVLINSRDYIRTLFDEIPVPTYLWQKNENDFILIDKNKKSTDFLVKLINFKIGKSAKVIFNNFSEIVDDMNECLKDNICKSREINLNDKIRDLKKDLRLKFTPLAQKYVITHLEDISFERKEKTSHSRTQLDSLNKNLEHKKDKIEERYDMIVGFLPVAIYHSTHKGANSSTIMSEKWEEWTGYSSDLLLENPDIWMKAVHPDDLKKVVKNYYEVSKEGSNYELEYRFIHRIESNITYVRDHGRFVKVLDDGSKFYTGFIEDITQQVKSKQKSQDLEQQYRLILENQNDLIYILNSKLEFEYVNEKVFMKLLGYDREDLKNHQPLDMIHPEDHKKAMKAIRKGILEGYGNVDLRIKTKNGDYKIHNLTGKLFEDSDGLQKALIISKDITEQKTTERLLRESEENYRMITENAFDVIGIINEKFEIEYVNKEALYATTKHSVEDVIGKSGLSFIHPEDLKKTRKSLIKGLKEGYGHELIRFRCKDGHYIWTECAGKIYKDNVGTNKGIIIIRDVSERVEVEKKLKISEENYRLITENSNDLIRVLDSKLKIEYINDQTHRRRLGFSSEELINKSANYLLHPDEKDEISIFIRKMVKEGEARRIGRIRKKDGNWIWADIWAKIIKDTLGNWKGLIISHNITERIMFEEKLKESEELYRLISENANDTIRILNDKFEFEYINEEIHEKILGYRKEDLIGKRSLDFYHPEDVKFAVRSTYKSLKMGKGSYEARFRCKNGEYKWFEFSGKIFYDSNNEKKILSFSRDVDERRKIFGKIQRSEELLRSFIRESYDGFALTDERGCIIEWNKGQEEIFGLKNLEVLNKPFWDVMFKVAPEEMRVEGYYTQMKKSVEDALKTGESPWLNRLREYAIVDSNGNKKIIQQLPFLIKLNSGTMLGSVIRDISKQKEFELALTNSEKKYRDAFDTANFYRDLFAHDINNILQVINSSAEMISLKNIDTERMDYINNMSEMIKTQVQRGKKMVSGVRMLSELDTQKISLYPVQIYPELNKAIEFIKKSYTDKDLIIQNDIVDKSISCQANDLLQEVFENILNNAVKYNESSSIEIDIRLSKYKSKSKEYIKIEFIDNGIGISELKKKLIFKKGNRDIVGSKGMGLGLSLVNKILQAYGGKIWVENRINNDHSKGSNFIIIIPKI